MGDRYELENKLRESRYAAGYALDEAEVLHEQGQLSKRDLKQISALYNKLVVLTERLIS